MSMPHKEKRSSNNSYSAVCELNAAFVEFGPKWKEPLDLADNGRVGGDPEDSIAARKVRDCSYMRVSSQQAPGVWSLQSLPVSSYQIN